MAPKRRVKKVVSSVVRKKTTKVVQETVQVSTAILPDDSAQPEPEVVVDVSTPATVVKHVEVTSDVGDDQATAAGATAVNNKPPQSKSPDKPADDNQATAPAVPSLQSQETQTQDPNEKKKTPQQEIVVVTTKGPPGLEPEEKTKKLQPDAPETPKQAGGAGTGGKDEAAAPKKKKKKKKKKRKARRGGGRRRGPVGDMGMMGGGYKRYVYRVLKQVHPDMGASGRAMEVLDMMMGDMFERLADEAARLAKVAGRATLSSREVQNAVRLVLPGELAKHAISEGTKAVTSYMSLA
ncbi:histone H2B.2 [Brachypodium distachyon]|uniref:Core Histone H2A/H2B/H3 domain-containing protein n=1 Tax=Brachypodium distachyon TaxID=15368 RepID=I1IT46_BRADI|nr:histone H2B.2 [Brachypodium distachyon]KQJ91633.1 hypothetical protein BRADI_4g38800v3 [Brachypodium distachyon]|eukprot:XP_014757906.1 histone H2B.2 [Brachypodium distachyon]